jgi:hypothetical protein
MRQQPQADTRASVYPPLCVQRNGMPMSRLEEGNLARISHPVSLLLTLASSGAIALAVCAGTEKPTANAAVLIMCCAVLGSATLFAPALPRTVAGDAQRARRRAVLWAGVLASLAGAAAAGLARPVTGVSIAALLSPMLVILQTLLGVGLRRPVLCTVVALLLAAPVWLSPLAEIAGSESGVAGWITLLSPVTHLAAVAGCDYLHADWVYSHSALAGLQRITPSPIGIIICYLAIAAALTAARALHFPKRMQESIR